MLKKLSIAAMLTMALGVVPMVGHASVPPEGCVSGGGQGTGDYDATQNGGIVGAGDYVVVVTHADLTTTTYTMADGPKLIDDGAIVAGDSVSCSANNGVVAAGNPLP